MRSWRILASLLVAGGIVAMAIGFIVIAAAVPATVPNEIVTPGAGPPYPDAVYGQRVYDNAGVFSASAEAEAEATIRAIEDRTGAQVCVYTQVKPESDTLDEANDDALALMNQWGVGRKGFDDGLVILFDMEDNLQHGQVSLYAGSGYRDAFLNDGDRQHIFDEHMKPLLGAGDMEGGLMAALREIDANATPEHAATLEQGRQINALIALAGVLIGLLLIGYAVASWLRHGRDPVYIDDDSILMPAPPPDLTPAMATVLLADRSSDRTVSAGLIDLAARRTIAFETDPAHPESLDVGIRHLGPGRRTPASEQILLDGVRHNARGRERYISPTRLYHLSDAFESYKDGLEKRAVERHWLRAKPSSVIGRWRLIGATEIAVAAVVGFAWLFVMASGLIILALGLLAAGIVTWVLAGSMPARTRLGAMLYAMLHAYRRTLERTMRQAQSMGEVVRARALPWVTTPDQVMAWGIAFGLNDELEAILERSMAAPETAPGGAPGAAWQPSWWLVHSGSAGAGIGLAASGEAFGSHGLFSSSAIPDPGAITAALGSIIHASPPYVSSSGGGGGSFGGGGGGGFGGGGGGGGGGAGGGF
jgi:uncharacterized membrane protein YgcG